MNESFHLVKSDHEIINIHGILVTSRDQTLYVHLNNAPAGNGVKLKPINIMPVKATLLNNGKPIDCVVNLSPSDHATQQPYLRLRNLPSADMADTVMVAKLEFDKPLDQIILAKRTETNVELTK